MTFNSEYQKADAALKEQQPGLLDGERFLKAGAKASVRTGSQVGAAALAGVAIGSVLPVGGTAVGFTVDSGIGAVMMFPVGEGIFNGIKGLFG